ncbi:MAG: sigma 54-interacting transcriptional regulator [Deltaproteobacteria bacterium]|nr:sigma 54-interacting transcriptional regulator [Deltaproteobacteria bacterium]
MSKTSRENHEEIVDKHRYMLKKSLKSSASTKNIQQLLKIPAFTNIAILIIDASCRIIFCNRAYKKLSAHKGKDSIGTGKKRKSPQLQGIKSVAELIVEGTTPAKIKRYYGAHARHVECADGEYSLEIFPPHLGERGMWLFSTAAPLTDKKGILIGAVQTLQDLNARKKIEDDLFDSEQKTQTILNQIEDGYYEVDLRGHTLSCNDALSRIFGYSRSELIGKSYKVMMGDKDSSEVFKIFNRVYKSGKPLSAIEMEIVRKDKHPRIIQLSTSLMRDAEGTPTGFRGIIRDVTDMRNAERALIQYKERLEDLVRIRTKKLRTANKMLRDEIREREKAEQNLRREKNISEDIIESIPSLFYVIDEKFKLIKWNKNVELVTGFSPDELLGMNTLEFFRNEDVPFVREKIKETFTKGRATAYVSYRVRSEMIPYFFTGVRTMINDKYYQVGVGIDRAELQETREALQESEARLSLAADSAEAGLWSLNINSGHIWATLKSLELHGVTPGREINFEGLLDIIHPEDRAQFAEAVQKTLKTGQDFKIEYRIPLPDGGIRWLAARGRQHSTAMEDTERLMGVSIDITERKLMEVQLQERLKEIEKLKEQLEKDNVYLREEVKLLFEHENIVGVSNVFKEVLAKAEQVAPTDSTVLILGETGTGKELLARAIHHMSWRRDRPLITVNCASLPPSLIESELFGREKGAYTGALTRMIGRFEVADGSTLFLDEIGELHYELQSKLLRVLEISQFERLGSTKTIQVNVRFIAASNRDLSKAVKEGKFRRDLYYRLNVFPIVIPPLRDRREDIPALIWAFVKKFENSLGKKIESIPQKSMDALLQHQWHGNVRELKNVIEHAMIMSNKTLNVAPTGLTSQEDVEYTDDLENIERRHIIGVLNKTGWRIAGKNGAADMLGLKRTTLISKMKVLGITRQKT